LVPTAILIGIYFSKGGGRTLPPQHDKSWVVIALQKKNKKTNKQKNISVIVTLRMSRSNINPKVVLCPLLLYPSPTFAQLWAC